VGFPLQSLTQPSGGCAYGLKTSRWQKSPPLIVFQSFNVEILFKKNPKPFSFPFNQPFGARPVFLPPSPLQTLRAPGLSHFLQPTLPAAHCWPDFPIDLADSGLPSNILLYPQSLSIFPAIKKPPASQSKKSASPGPPLLLKHNAFLWEQPHISNYL
jgi:hypothetical protein